MKPTFGPMPTCEANEYSRERQRRGLHQSPEGLLLLGSLSGDWGGGSHGNSWKQQCRDLHRLFTAAKSKPSWTSGSNLGNGPAHRGAAIRSYLTTPNLHLRLVALPAYSPDFNADEAVWDWAREEVTANECHGTKAKVQEKMNQFFGGLIHRKDEVKHRCRTRLQARADVLIFTPAVPLPSLPNVVPTLALLGDHFYYRKSRHHHHRRRWPNWVSHSLRAALHCPRPTRKTHLHRSL